MTKLKWLLFFIKMHQEYSSSIIDYYSSSIQILQSTSGQTLVNDEY